MLGCPTNTPPRARPGQYPSKAMCVGVQQIHPRGRVLGNTFPKQACVCVCVQKIHPRGRVLGNTFPQTSMFWVSKNNTPEGASWTIPFQNKHVLVSKQYIHLMATYLEPHGERELSHWVIEVVVHVFHVTSRGVVVVANLQVGVPGSHGNMPSDATHSTIDSKTRCNPCKDNMQTAQL